MYNFQKLSLKLEKQLLESPYLPLSTTLLVIHQGGEDIRHEHAN